MLKAEKLRKQFSTVLAVDDVSLEVKRGSIFGLIGPNGAGKSTTIRMLLNIYSPDTGTVLFDGKPFSAEVQNNIGYLPEERGLYKKNTLIDSILYFASLKGMERSDAKKKAMAMLRRFDIETYASRKIEELSKGNQQKVQFIISILHDPELVVLDEPFSGLDPVNQILLKEIFQELKQKGKAIIFSTHQMDTAEKLCDEICLINRGKIVLEGTVSGVKQSFGKNSLHLEYNGDGKFLESLPFVAHANIYENYAELCLRENIRSQEILSAVAAKLDIRKFEYVEPSLNAIFIDTVGLPAEAVDPAVSAAPVRIRKNTSSDPKVRKALFSLIILGTITIVNLIITLKNRRTIDEQFFIFLALTVFGIGNYFWARKKSGMREEGKGGGNAQ